MDNSVKTPSSILKISAGHYLATVNGHEFFVWKSNGSRPWNVCGHDNRVSSLHVYEGTKYQKAVQALEAAWRRSPVSGLSFKTLKAALQWLEANIPTPAPAPAPTPAPKKEVTELERAKTWAQGALSRVRMADKATKAEEHKVQLLHAFEAVSKALAHPRLFGDGRLTAASDQLWRAILENYLSHAHFNIVEENLVDFIEY